MAEQLKRIYKVQDGTWRMFLTTMIKKLQRAQKVYQSRGDFEVANPLSSAIVNLRSALEFI